MKFYIGSQDRYIDIDQAFTLNDIQYPAGYLRSITPTEREAMGLVEVVEVGERKDDRYYFNSEELVGAELRITSIAKSLESVKELKLSELAAYRYGIETGGVTVGDTVIRTDRESQAQLGSAWITTQINPAATVDWKGENGWVWIGATEIAAISANVSSHVQSCFTKERTLATVINALTTVEEVIAYDIATRWAAI